VKIGLEEMKIVRVESKLPPPILKKLSRFLAENVDIFAWIPTNMPKIDPGHFCHKLMVDSEEKLYAKREGRWVWRERHKS